eukprot:TRINITY_DN3258_c0_g2_i2.p2 TRINITY_DN3258_c0_g2~~TRINITY_DN3258_c0_g2_i2.p2  ORF type:complete len:364 (-),score=40.28 TRINITY_DN3258_c0_g2_i2:755-1846(-)
MDSSQIEVIPPTMGQQRQRCNNIQKLMGPYLLPSSRRSQMHKMPSFQVAYEIFKLIQCIALSLRSLKDRQCCPILCLSNRHSSSNLSNRIGRDNKIIIIQIIIALKAEVVLVTTVNVEEEQVAQAEIAVVGLAAVAVKKSNPKVQEQKSDNGFKQDTAGVLRLGKQVEELKGQMLSMKDEIKALQAQLNESQWNNFHLSTAMGKLQTEVERLRAIVDKRGARSKPQQRIAPPSFFNPPKDHPQARNDSKEVVMNSVEKQIVEVPKQESKQVQQKQAMEDRKEDVDKAKKRRKSGKGSRGSKNESGEGDERNNNKSGGEQSGRSRSRGNGRGGRGRGRGRGQNGGGGALDNNTTSKSIQPVALQ